MTTTNMNPEDRIEYWRMVMEDLDESGLSRTEYCEKNDIKISTFDYWKRRISDIEASDNEGPRFAELILDPNPVRFAELILDPNPVQTTPSTKACPTPTQNFVAQMMVTCGDITLHINNDTPSELITRILKVMQDA